MDDYIANAAQWQDEFRRLREILQSTELTEDVKSGAPCYTYDNKNVVGILGFKSYFGFWFHQGVLLEDRKKVLINAQEGKTKALRQWRMNSPNYIKPATIKAYVREAIQLVKDGAKSKSESMGSGSIESDPIDPQTLNLLVDHGRE